jgi:mannose-1-phosphate guanylyltransferase
VIEAGAEVRRSVIGRGAVIGPQAVVTSAVIGDGARIGARNELLGGVRVFPGAALADGAVRFSSDRASS